MSDELPYLCAHGCVVWGDPDMHDKCHDEWENQVSNPDPNSYIQASAQTLAETLASKTSDYAPTGEFSNFEESSELADTTPLSAILLQIGIKVTRIKALHGKEPNNESLKDSLLDLAGYATIAHAYLEYTGSSAAMDAYQAASNEMREAMEGRCHGGLAHGWRRTGVDEYVCMNCNTRAEAGAFDE